MDHHALPNRIRVLGDGSIRWNGEKVTERVLVDRIEQSGDLAPRPFLILVPSPGTGCSNIERVRTLMNAGYCKEKWACGEGEGPWQPVMFGPNMESGGELTDAADNVAMEASVTQPD